MVFGGVFANPPLPDKDGHKHNGVASCAGSTCHGAVRPFAESNILHNEFITWTREDRHAKAYRTLLNEKSKLIAQKLGIKAPHTETICLDCHASNVPEKLRGKKFQINEGVGCESCHGGSERWLNSHTDKKATHEENIKKGLYPTEDPAARAKLCLSCHFGNDDKFVTHRIMGAGHPRLSIELDTFTALMPPHHDVDADYKKRKAHFNASKTWAIGQLASIEALLSQLESRALQGEQLFPELSLFDCHSCHHRMSNQRWRARSTSGLGPGVVRLHDANFIMLHAILEAVDVTRANRLKELLRKLHRSTTKSTVAIANTVAELKLLLAEIKLVIGQQNFSVVHMRLALNKVVDAGLSNQLLDYAAAEQATMGIGALLSDLDTESVFNKKQQDAINKQLNGLYACVENDEKYKPACFVSALKKFYAVAK
jgi:hypothetical protein